jgi:hypothetical protein
MAKSKQTAARSTGGKAPRQELASKAARKSKVGPICASDCLNPAVQIALVDNRYEVHRVGGRVDRIGLPDADGVIGEEIRHWLRHHPGRALTKEIYARWDLGEWTAIPEQPADEEDCSPVVLPTDTWEPHSVKLKMGSSVEYWCSSIDSKLIFHRVVFSTMLPEMGARKQAESLDKVDRWCMENEGKEFLLTSLGSRGRVFGEIPQEIQSRKIITYKTSTAGCAIAALANLTAGRDAGQAAFFGASVSQINFRNLRALAQWTERSSNFTLRRVEKYLCSPVERLEYILARERTGQYLVVLQDEEGSSSHVVGIDCRAQLVFDSMERFATKLCRFSLDRSVGSGGVCVGVDDLRRVTRKEVSQRKRKRISQ